ncbi:helix-turn-helix transcriptional regulator [Brevundimonas sp. PAMC22021]|uniref:helix-turn-helix transcriptional regulator n=1 Tax=Brevundimonas sp. PAMC22021 TaxID=2861285 RepID=UPI001C631732|nr:helix-turn-helix transcriptional regulator [Brevundimonas sp. PAMC22021]QYF85958.1 helix-turn-helix transcriptional regulator [Brevundimonas sp. PAMC22021]
MRDGIIEGATREPFIRALGGRDTETDARLGALFMHVRAMAAWLDADPRGRVLVSRSGRIAWANEAARRMLEDGEHFCESNNLLICLSEDGSALLHRMLRTAREEAKVAAIVSQTGRHWLLRVQLLAPEDDASIGVTFCPMEASISYDVMLQAHHLTPCEARIVTMMLAGLETGRIAQRQDISMETLRTHIKHAYRKLDVTSRDELYAMASAFAGI